MIKPDASERVLLIAALETLARFFSLGEGTSADVDRAGLVVASTVTAFAMSKFCDRIIDDGFVRDDRVKELQARSRNMLAGVGFLVEDPNTQDLGDEAAAMFD